MSQGHRTSEVGSGTERRGEARGVRRVRGRCAWWEKRRRPTGVTPPSPSPQERDSESPSPQDSSNGPSQDEEEDAVWQPAEGGMGPPVSVSQGEV
jgi:hypothetical protein